MAKPRARKLKVFQARIGFYDTVVAAPSQAVALRAWGVHQNLFASGDARITDDEAAAKAAVEHPETPLRRAIGSSDPFELEPKGLPAAPKGPKRPRAAKATSQVQQTAPPPPPDRSNLDAAEAALRRVDERRKAEEAQLRREEDALAQRKSDAQAAYVEARKAATAAVVAARATYRKAGGTR